MKEEKVTNNNLKLFESHKKSGRLNNEAYDNLVGKKDPKKSNHTYEGDIISVIIPTYNRKEQLQICIDSILEQSYKSVEIIVVDDGSTDGTEKLFKDKYKSENIIYSMNETNSGAGVSRNRGYRLAKGRYIIFCDDDDYYIDPSHFKNMIDIFSNSEISAIFSNSYVKYEKQNKYQLNELNISGLISAREYLENFQFNYKKPNSTFTAIFRKETFELSRLENMKMVNDSSIYLRSLIFGNKVFFNDLIIGIYSVHSKNISFNIKAEFLIANLEEKKNIYEIIKKENIVDDPDRWFYEQISLTVKYFIEGSNPKKDEKEKVLSWIRENFIHHERLLKELKLFSIKIKTKRVIKKVIKH